MLAAVLRAFGGPDGLAVEEVPTPLPGSGEALVRVRAVCVNRTDVHVMHRTKIGRNATLPHIGGVDPAGEVVALGPGVDGIKLGQRVVARPMIPCLLCRFCVGGRESLCERPTYVGVHRPGGFGELVALPTRALYALPDGVDFVTAAAFAHSVPIALHLLRSVGEVGAEDTVLVMGAAGGFGVAAVQVARALGARVIAAARSLERLAPMADMVDGMVAYDLPASLTARVRELSAGHGATVAIDNVGDITLWPHVIASMDKGGRILSAGSHAGTIMPLDLPVFYSRQLRLLATSGFSGDEFLEALDLVAQDRVKLIVRRGFSIEGVSEAFTELLNRQAVGKIVIEFP